MLARGLSFSELLLLPPASSTPLNPPCSTSSSSSILVTHASVREFLSPVGSRKPPENRQSLIRVRLFELLPSSPCPNPLVRSTRTTNTPSLLHYGILWPVLVFSMYDSRGPNTTMFPSSTFARTEANSLLTAASRSFLLHLVPSRTNSILASPSTRIGLPLCNRQPHRLRSLCSRHALLSGWPDILGSSRLDKDLHDPLHHVNCVHLLNLPVHLRSDSNRQICRTDASSSHLSSPDACTSYTLNSGRTRHVDPHECF